MLTFLIAFAVIVVDYFTKYAVSSAMKVGDSFPMIPGLFNCTYVLNKGAAWGMLADKRWIFLVFSTVAIVLLAVLAVRNAKKKGSTVFSAAIGLIMGGGIGNMIDRTFNGDVLFDGAVVDFIETAFMDFPVFNVADSAVCVGCALLFIYILFVEGKKDKDASAKVTDVE